MTGPDKDLAIFGTDEPVAAERRVECGDLSFLLEPESVRAISWRGIEVVRGLAWPIRDPGWVTLVQENVRQTDVVSDDGFRCSLAFAAGGGALACELVIQAQAKGHLRADLSMTAVTDFDTNRAGFTVLHPITGVAGSPLAVHHSDGTTENTTFPEYISPDQPAKDIVGLAYGVDGVSVDITFSGEVFEMEDQRNWTDASYKTYCVPLVYPFTYTIPAGKTVTQSIDLAFAGQPAGQTGAAAGAVPVVAATEKRFPDIGLALEPGWLDADRSAELVSPVAARCLQVRVGTDPDDGYLAASSKLADALGVEIDAEIVLTQDEDPQAALSRSKAMLDAVGITPKRVTALPEGYLASHQPSGPWPEGATPQQAARAARTVFPEALIGGGVLTNFTEFNRCRPDPDHVDFVTHGTTAIVHAADDRSVIETLEALPQVFASAHNLSGGKPCRVGLVSIGMRSNPYGADVAPNPDLKRQTMAREDPRQRGLFAAAWAVGAVAAAAEAGVEALSLGAPAGPFGLFGDLPEQQYLPLFHIVRFAAGLSGRTVCAVAGLPKGVHGFAATTGNATSIALANLSQATVAVALPAGHDALHVLDTTSFRTACGDANWLDQATTHTGSAVTLDPFAVAVSQTVA